MRSLVLAAVVALGALCFAGDVQAHGGFVGVRSFGGCNNGFAVRGFNNGGFSNVGGNNGFVIQQSSRSGLFGLRRSNTTIIGR